MQYSLQNAVGSAKYYRLQTKTKKKAAKHTCKICFTTDRHNQVSNNSVVLKTKDSYGSIHKFGEKEWQSQTPEKYIFPREATLFSEGALVMIPWTL